MINEINNAIIKETINDNKESEFMEIAELIKATNSRIIKSKFITNKDKLNLIAFNDTKMLRHVFNSLGIDQ